MKLLTYNINNSLFVILNNIIIKKTKNIYKIYINNVLKYVFNSIKFNNYIKKNYSQSYNKINKLINKNITGGSEVQSPEPTPEPTPESTPEPTQEPTQEPVKTDNSENSDSNSSEGFLSGVNPLGSLGSLNPLGSSNTGNKEFKDLLKNDYFEVYKIVLITNKIVPNEINLDYFIELFYKEIKTKLSNFSFTKDYLVRQLNKGIDDKNKLGNVCSTDKQILEDLFSKNNHIQEFYDKIYLLEQIKHSIKDDTDKKDENIIKYKYVFNINEGGTFFNGNINDFLDKIFVDAFTLDVLGKLETYIKNKLIEHISSNTTGLVDIGSLISLSGISEYFNNYEKKEIDSELEDESLKNNKKYSVDIKYNKFDKTLNIVVQIDKIAFDSYFERGVNKLATNEMNKEETEAYMKKLKNQLNTILNQFIKNKILQYIVRDTNTNNSENELGNTNEWDTYKTTLKKIKKDYFDKHFLKTPESLNDTLDKIREQLDTIENVDFKITLDFINSLKNNDELKNIESVRKGTELFPYNDEYFTKNNNQNYNKYSQQIKAVLDEFEEFKKKFSLGNESSVRFSKIGSFTGFNWNSYDKSAKEDIAIKIKKINFDYKTTINLSLYNYVKLEQYTMSMLDSFIDNEIEPEEEITVDKNDKEAKKIKLFDENKFSIEVKPNTPTIFHKILNIKYSKCSNKDLKNVPGIKINNYKNEGLATLVVYRDLKKIPKNFMEDFVYKKDTTTEDVGWLFNGTKSVESGLIVKTVIENMYIKTKELKLDLSNIFINYFIDVFKSNLKLALLSFSFDKSYKTDNLEKIIEEVISYNQDLSKIMNESNIMITFNNLMIYEDIKNKYNVSISKLETDNGNGDAKLFEFKNSNFSPAQIKLKMDLLNKLILFTIKLTYFELFKKNNTLNLLSQLLIKFIFDQVINFSDKNNKNKILKEIKSIIEIKLKKYITLINTDEVFTEGFNISILDIIDKQKISRLKLRQQDDKAFIASITPEQELQKLEDLEKKLFDEKIIEGSKEEFVNNIMFFYKNKNNYEIEKDEKKNTLFGIFSKKLLNKIRNYYKKELENEFNVLNNKHKQQLEELGLNVDKEQLDNDEELSDKLENEIIKLNDYKFSSFKSIEGQLNNISNSIIGTDTPLFTYIINKYIIQNRKMPIDFSAEYQKTLLLYQENLKRLIEIFTKDNLQNLMDKKNKLKEELELLNIKLEEEINLEKEKNTQNPKIDKNSIDIATSLTSLVASDTYKATTLTPTPEKTLDTIPTREQTPTPEKTLDTIPTREQTPTPEKTYSQNNVDSNSSNYNSNSTTIEAPQVLADNSSYDFNIPGLEGGNIIKDTIKSSDTVGLTKMSSLDKVKYEITNKKMELKETDDSINNLKNESLTGDEDKLQNFIAKMTELSDKSDTSPQNINIAITKLQLMYFVQNKNYLNLITAYSSLSDSYHKLVKLEKINKLPTTKKPSILILIDKLFINNLIHNKSEDEDEDEDIEDDKTDSGLFGFYQEETDTNSSRLKKKTIVEPPKLTRSKLFDGLDYSEDKDLDLKKNETVIVDIKSGEKM